MAIQRAWVFCLLLMGCTAVVTPGDNGDIHAGDIGGGDARAGDIGGGDNGAGDIHVGDAGAGDGGDANTGDTNVCTVGDDDRRATYGAELFISPGGNDSHPGSEGQPFATLERARTAIRDLKATDGLPPGGVVVWLRQGVHERASTFELDAQDSGSADAPVVYRGYPCEQARVVGAARLEAEWFAPVTDQSPTWSRVDPSAHGHLVQVDLAAQGITNYGTLTQRGFGATHTAALELFVDSEPMQLARWPDAHEHDPVPSHEDDQIILCGDPDPDVTGTYVQNGTSDGVNAYARNGLVDGLQYNLYRWTWDYQGNTYTAWFITTHTSGYPSDTNPWWHRYDDFLGEFSPGPVGIGIPTIFDPDRVNHGFVSIAMRVSDTAFTYQGSRPERWSQAEDLWLHGFWMHMWADRHMPVANLDTATKIISFADVPGYGIEAGQPYYALNLLEEITVPGEWYLDRGAGILYLWPPSNLSRAEVWVSLLEDSLVRVVGTSYVTFQDIIFEMTRERLVDLDGDHNTLKGCILRNAGTDAVEVLGVSNGLDHCGIYATGDRGVALRGGTRASLTPANNFVHNSHIREFGRWSWTYKPALSVSGVGQVVAHNRIHDAPHSAILFGGNEHLIELNEIYAVCQFSSDAGAIYSGRDWGYRGNVIRHNFIHHIATAFEGYGVHGVYLDDCLSGIRVFGNVFYEVSGHAIQHGGGRDNLMENNVVARCGDALGADSRGISRITNTPGDSWNLLERLARDGIQYQAEPWASAYPELAAIPNDWATISDPSATWLYPEGCVFSRNIGFDNVQWIRESNYGGTGTLNKYAEIADNIEDQDPLFVDEANLDLTLLPNSPALAIPGFVAIPFDQIGIEAP
ncbi:right-handed parallel beta-helix repeat-containing protein [Myxococcota bacterium]